MKNQGNRRLPQGKMPKFQGAPKPKKPVTHKTPKSKAAPVAKGRGAVSKQTVGKVNTTNLW
jgi:hypothetical protein